MAKTRRPLASLGSRVLVCSSALGLLVGLGASACVNQSSGGNCEPGTFACTCFVGDVCFAGLSCVSGICIDVGPGETSGDAEGDGDGDTGDGDGDGDTGEGDGDGDTGGVPCAGTPELLYSQDVDSGSGVGMLAQTFTDQSGSAVEVADDFTIPKDDGCWCITQIVVRGFYGMGEASAPLTHVEIWDDEGGKPGPTSSWTYEGAPMSDEAGILTVVPDAPVVVPMGTHWLSVRPEGAGATFVWYWNIETASSGAESHTRDPDMLAFTDCPEWMPASSCYDPFPPEYSDYEFSNQFDIYGVVDPSCP
jgi:hypothetical protein